MLYVFIFLNIYLFKFRTLLEQSAVITMKGVPLTDYCENLMINTMVSNAQKVNKQL